MCHHQEEKPGVTHFFIPTSILWGQANIVSSLCSKTHLSYICARTRDFCAQSQIDDILQLINFTQGHTIKIEQFSCPKKG